MQNQQQFDAMSNMSGETLAPPNERQSTTDPCEQTRKNKLYLSGAAESLR